MLIAVTGANGFIGSYLCKYLIKVGYQIRPLQRGKGKNVFLINDFKNYNNWAKALSGVDVVVHCASKVHSFQNSLEEMSDYELINVLATENIAREAAKLNIKKFIFLSTVKVYGEKTLPENPFNNKTKLQPSDEYSRSKYKAENILKELSNKYGLKFLIIRIPLVYGPGVGANFLNLIKLVNLNFPLPFGNIRNKRSIIFVGNLADFIFKCIESKKAVNKNLVVSDLSPLSTKDLIRMIAKGLNKKIIIFKFPLKFLKFLGKLIGNNEKLNRLTESLEVDASETFGLLNWIPPYSSEEGINSTINWFKSNSKKSPNRKLL